VSTWAKSTARIAWAWVSRSVCGGVRDLFRRCAGFSRSWMRRCCGQVQPVRRGCVCIPGRVLPRQLNDQITNGLADTWSIAASKIGKHCATPFSTPNSMRSMWCSVMPGWTTPGRGRAGPCPGAYGLVLVFLGEVSPWSFPRLVSVAGHDRLSTRSGTVQLGASVAKRS
jgi:hypothetical protein